MLPPIEDLFVRADYGGPFAVLYDPATRAMHLWIGLREILNAPSNAHFFDAMGRERPEPFKIILNADGTCEVVEPEQEIKTPFIFPEDDDLSSQAVNPGDAQNTGSPL